MQFTTNIAKVDFTMAYLTEFTQNWLEIGLDQEKQEICQNWLKTSYDL